MSPYPCIPHIGFFDSPEVLSLVLHIMTALSTPIHCLSLYCIIFETPSQMKSVKMSLLNLHIWIVLLDYSLGLFGVPILLFPCLAGFPVGITRYLGIPTVAQAAFFVINVTFMVVAIVAVFENRFHVVCDYPAKLRWHVWRRPWLAGHLIGICIACLTFIYLVPDQKVAKNHLLETLPCLPDYIYNEEIFILTEGGTYHMILYVIFILLTGSEFLLFIGLLTHYTMKQLKIRTMSLKTYSIQRKFLKALLLQMSLPLIFLLIPCFYSYASIFGNYYNQGLNNLAMVIAAIQGGD